jgi:hypothetical protein
MRRFGLFCFNVLLAVGGATLYAWLVRRDGWTDEAWLKALQEGGAAGFLSGVTVGLGATLGPRPALSTKKCITGQIVIAATSLLGGAIAYLFPSVRNAVDEALAERGILWGSGVGMVIGTVFQFFEIYFKRRRAAR